MPFLSKCHRCGFIVVGLNREFLNVEKGKHDQRSHHDNDWEHRYPTWLDSVISGDEYRAVKHLGQIPSFWRAFRLANPSL